MNIWVKFVHKGHQVRVKITAAKAFLCVLIAGGLKGNIGLLILNSLGNIITNDL